MNFLWCISSICSSLKTRQNFKKEKMIKEMSDHSAFWNWAEDVRAHCPISTAAFVCLSYCDYKIKWNKKGTLDGGGKKPGGLKSKSREKVVSFLSPMAAPAPAIFSFSFFLSTQREIIQVDSVCGRRGGNLVFLGISPTHRRRDRKVLFSRWTKRE
jgi:hypothetical protein